MQNDLVIVDLKVVNLGDGCSNIKSHQEDFPTWEGAAIHGDARVPRATTGQARKSILARDIQSDNDTSDK